MSSATLRVTLLAAFFQAACATALEPVPSEDEPSGGTAGGGNVGHAGTSTTSGGTASAGSSARGGSGGNASSGNAGRANTGGNGNAGGSGGNAGTIASGGTANGGTANGGSANGGSANGGTANGGSATGGSVNQGGGASCDQGAATPLAAMSSNTPVKSDACLAIQIPADQTWIKKVTLQPEGATYPLPFTWSNCGTNSNASFTANYGNVVLESVSSLCPILIKLGGSGAQFNVQWWGG